LRNRLAETSRRNADMLAAMGMANALRSRWLDFGRVHLAQQKRVNDVTGGLGAAHRVRKRWNFVSFSFFVAPSAARSPSGSIPSRGGRSANWLPSISA
jgi:hypothetical protein